MKKDRIRVLLVENDHDDVALFDEIVTEVNGNNGYDYQFVIVPALSIQEAREYLDVDTTDVMILALTLPEGSSKDILSRLESFYCDIPTVTLVQHGDMKSGKESIQHGVQDYLIKGEITAERMSHSIINAIERHKLTSMTQTGSMIDDLTQIYNARGFHRIVRHGVALAKRKNLGITFIYVDVDDLSQINRDYGVRGGETTLKVIASILKSSFRESDIVARLGSDDFVVVSLGSSTWADPSISTRIERALSQVRDDSRIQWDIPLSIGTVFIDKDFGDSVEDHIAIAQKKMYDHRRLKRTTRMIRSEAT
jgi:diguanylate cyclase (GGDEF)-like protein